MCPGPGARPATPPLRPRAQRRPGPARSPLHQAPGWQAPVSTRQPARRRRSRRRAPPRVSGGPISPLDYRRTLNLGSGSGSWIRVQDQRRARRLVEVEIRHQVAELRVLLADVWSRVRPTISLRIQPRPAQEYVLDELHVCVVAQRLVIDAGAARVRTDHESWPPP